MIDIADDEFEELPPRDTPWQVLDRATAYRKQLLACGYWPVPVNGKAVHLDSWQSIRATNAIIDTWATTRPDHLNTGILTCNTPTVDIDVLAEDVAEEIEALFEHELESSATRIGASPKRPLCFAPIHRSRKFPRSSNRRMEHCTRLKSCATASKSSSMACIRKHNGLITGTVMSRDWPCAVKTCH